MASAPDINRGTQILQDYISAGFSSYMDLPTLVDYYNQQNPLIIGELGAIADDANLTNASYNHMLATLQPGFLTATFGTPTPPALNDWVSAFAAGESSLITIVPQAAAATVSQVATTAATVATASMGIYLAYLGAGAAGLWLLSKLTSDGSTRTQNPRRRRRHGKR